MFRFIDREAPKAKLTEDYVEALESSLNIRFPEPLRTYYLEHNGAEIRECRFELHGFEFCVVLLNALGYGNVSVEKILRFNAKNAFIPKTFIPFALDEDEDDYYWDAVNGKVYYLSRSNVENPIEICDSVEAFFDILNSCD